MLNCFEDSPFESPVGVPLKRQTGAAVRKADDAPFWQAKAPVSVVCTVDSPPYDLYCTWNSNDVFPKDTMINRSIFRSYISQTRRYRDLFSTLHTSTPTCWSIGSKSSAPAEVIPPPTITSQAQVMETSLQAASPAPHKPSSTAAVPLEELLPLQIFFSSICSSPLCGTSLVLLPSKRGEKSSILSASRLQCLDNATLFPPTSIFQTTKTPFLPRNIKRRRQKQQTAYFPSPWRSIASSATEVNSLSFINSTLLLHAAN